MDWATSVWPSRRREPASRKRASEWIAKRERLLAAASQAPPREAPHRPSRQRRTTARVHRTRAGPARRQAGVSGDRARLAPWRPRSRMVSRARSLAQVAQGPARQLVAMRIFALAAEPP